MKTVVLFYLLGTFAAALVAVQGGHPPLLRQARLRARLLRQDLSGRDGPQRHQGQEGDARELT